MMMRCLVAVGLVLSASAIPVSMIAKGSRHAAMCVAEKQAGKNPSASRGDACDECKEFREAHKDADWVTENKGLCTVCYSVKSSCDEGQFAWNCYDVNEQFDIMKKNGVNEDADEPDEQ